MSSVRFSAFDLRFVVVGFCLHSHTHKHANLCINMSSKRLAKEWKELAKETGTACTAQPDGDDMFSWSGVIYGPPDSPYEV